MTLHLVRHGRPLLDPDRPAALWDLDPDGLEEVDALRASGRLPQDAVWCSSPEPKARQTAARLTGAPVAVVDALAEQRRDAGRLGTSEEFRAAVRLAFAAPERAAVPGWEPLAVTRDRVVPAVRHLLRTYDGPLVLVGHGTAWTVVVAALTGRPPDLAAWEGLRTPDVWPVSRPHDS
jgi:broad specificity phosphatase PhoE